MSFDIDVAIFIGFLILNLIVGINHAKKIKTIQDFALGGRSFTTSAIVATLVATWIGGVILFISLAKVYTEGITMIVAYLFIPATFLIIGYIFVPRMQEFLGNLSVATGMKAQIIIDSESGSEIIGTIRNISPATGAKFSLLPPANATGNFTKIVQRVPVIIDFTTPENIKNKIVPGMSTLVRIRTDQKMSEESLNTE